MEMKVLVTGGAGFIGSHTVEALVQAKIPVVVVDNLSTGKQERLPLGVTLYQVDATSDHLDDVFAKEKPDAVIHLAAQVNVSRSMLHPVGDALNNVIGTLQVLSSCAKYQVKKVIYASSCAAYGRYSRHGLTESALIDPISFYGTSKYAAEMYFPIFKQLYDLNYTIFRYANVYGPRQGENGEGGVVAKFITQMRTETVPTIYGNGEQTRDFIYVKDIANANVLALYTGDNQTMNIGTSIWTSINDLYQLIASELHFPGAPRFQTAKEGDIRHSTLNCEKAVKELGWLPKYKLRQGIIETIEASVY